MEKYAVFTIFVADPYEETVFKIEEIQLLLEFCHKMGISCYTRTLYEDKERSLYQIKFKNPQYKQAKRIKRDTVMTRTYYLDQIQCNCEIQVEMIEALGEAFKLKLPSNLNEFLENSSDDSMEE